MMESRSAGERTTPAGIEAAGHTDIGRVREENEDAYFVDDRETDLACRGVWMAMGVADGLGGHASGEVASRIAVETALRVLAGLGRVVDDGGAEWRRRVEARMRETFATAHRRIEARAQSDPSCAGMGSTLVLAALARGALVVAHAGDSRAYLVRGGIPRQLTSDHTWAEEQRRKATLPERDILASPVRECLTRAVGVGSWVEPDIGWFDLAAGDVVLLATDGLTRYVDPATYHRTVDWETSVADIAAELVRQANESGGADNTTVVVARTGSPGSPMSQARSTDFAGGAP